MSDMTSRTVLELTHDITLAAWFGGSLMGAIALNGATIEVDDHTQRIRVANAGWFRWAPFATLAVAGHLASALMTGRLPVPPLRSGQPELAWIRAGVTAAALLATVETGVSGRRVVQAGDVPVATAVTPVAATPVEVAAAQRRLRVAQWLVPGFTAGLWAIDALQDR